MVRKWITGKEILEEHKLTKTDFLQHILSGRLIPFRYGILLSPGPDEDQTMHRLFPRRGLDEKYVELRKRQDQLRRAKERSNQDEEILLAEHLKTDPQVTDVQTFLERLLKIQEQDRQTMEKLPPEIQALEYELQPTQAWAGLDLSHPKHEDLVGRLLESSYLREEVEAVRGSRKAKKRAENQLMWERAENEAKALKGKKRYMTLEAIAGSDEVNRCFEGKVPAISTIIKHLQGKGISRPGRPRTG